AITSGSGVNPRLRVADASACVVSWAVRAQSNTTAMPSPCGRGFSTARAAGSAIAARSTECTEGKPGRVERLPKVRADENRRPLFLVAHRVRDGDSRGAGDVAT